MSCPTPGGGTVLFGFGFPTLRVEPPGLSVPLVDVRFVAGVVVGRYPRVDLLGWAQARYLAVGVTGFARRRRWRTTWVGSDWLGGAWRVQVARLARPWRRWDRSGPFVWSGSRLQTLGELVGLTVHRVDTPTGGAPVVAALLGSHLRGFFRGQVVYPLVRTLRRPPQVAGFILRLAGRLGRAPRAAVQRGGWTRPGVVRGPVRVWHRRDRTRLGAVGATVKVWYRADA